ncbi:MAG: hypothetical protein IJV22_09595 [Bacteroidales bacterium]|nr:hypothetical protein [Bacteroidales bacterium]
MNQRIFSLGSSTLMLLCSLMLFAACTVYNPTASELPLLREKGEWRADGGMILSDNFEPALTLGASYAPWNHVAFQVSAATNMADKATEHQNFGLFAVGTFLPYAQRSVLELYAGIIHGYGAAHSNLYVSKPDEGWLRATYNLPYLQANWGIVGLGAFDLGIGLRTGRLFNSAEEYCYFAGHKSDDGLRQYEERLWIIEPTAMMRVGGEHVKFSLRLGYSHINGTLGSDRHFPYASFSLAAGVSLHF